MSKIGRDVADNDGIRGITGDCHPACKCREALVKELQVLISQACGRYRGGKIMGEAKASSKIAREIAEGLEETLIAGNHSKHASYVLGVIPKSELEEFVDSKLAPTLALMARLDKCVELAIELHDKQCEICSSEFPCGYSLALSSALTDYEAYLKEQG